MNHPSEYGALRFCPKCGTEGLERDHYPDGAPAHTVSTRQPKNGCEYVCRVCGFGVLLAKSRRVFASDALHKEHRKMRAGVTFTEKCVGAAIAEAFNRAALPTESEEKQ